ncbi:alpha/beta hydrolase [Ruminococcus sp.]|uniref:alpha/beta fold hydrolase n=1 Tax=Ruminococcus sp. TaxID=41978 RepID=UPI0025EA55E5|nr:alpha/beta hydrolase [Ruminococcus sp.]MCR4639379.1 alpha/beta hydrolase [Ruminococcus sp.]
MIKTVNGLKINYEEKGEGDLIVLLHGWGSNITLFANMIELLSKKYKVVAMDMPGFGKSDEPKEVWDVSSYVQFVIDFLRDYDTKEVMLLGHSFGGRVIIKMHSRSDLPFKVTKVILVDSAGIMPPKSNKKSWRTRYYKLGRTVLSWGIVKKLFPDALENFRKKMGSADYAAASPMMRQVMVKVVNEDLEPYLPNIKAPTLLVWGVNDTATPLSDGEKMEKLIPDAGLVKLENAGHYSFLEQQFTFNRVMCSFMKIED